MITEQEAIGLAESKKRQVMPGGIREVNARLAEWAIQELARREAERAERAKPIDAEWCLVNVAVEVADARIYRWVFKDVRVDWDDHNGTTIDEFGGEWTWLPSIATRGQLLDLLAALKGGA